MSENELARVRPKMRTSLHACLLPVFLVFVPKPRSLRHWQPINTSQKPCTFRGVDWEVYNLHQESHIDVCNLHREQDIVAVLQFKDLVLKRDWEQLEEKTGIRTNAKALDSLITRAIDRGMSYPVALANGLDELRASLWTNAPEAPTGAQLPGMPSFSTAQEGLLPMAHVGTEHGPLRSLACGTLAIDRTWEWCGSWCQQLDTSTTSAAQLDSSCHLDTSTRAAARTFCTFQFILLSTNKIISPGRQQ